MIKRVLNAFQAFNDVVTNVRINAKSEADGLHVLYDVSDSMRKFKTPVRLSVSALSAVTGLKSTDLPLPPPSKHTNLVGALEEVSSTVPPGATLLVVTDGDDTHFDTTEIPTSLDANGERVYTKLTRWPSSQEDITARREAVLDFMSNVIQCDVHLLGIGEEVKDFIRMASKKKKLKVAHVNTYATPRQMVSTMHVTLEPAVTTGDTGVITVETPRVKEFSEGLDDRFMNAIVQGAGDVTIEGQDDVASLKLKFERAEEAVQFPESEKHYTRGVVLWFMKQMLSSGGPLPGALIGGSRRHVFDPPNESRSWKSAVNALLTSLCNTGVLKRVHKATEVKVCVDEYGLCFTYHDCQLYDVSADAGLVEAITLEGTWSCPKESLCVNRSRKRPRSV